MLNFISNKFTILKSVSVLENLIADDLVSGIFRSSLLELLRKMLVVNIFLNSKKMYLVKFTTIWKFLERLWMTSSANFDDKILLSSNMNSLKSNQMLFWEIMLIKKFFYKEKELIKVNKAMFRLYQKAFLVYRIDLFTLEHDNFGLIFKTASLRFWKWYVIYRIGFQNDFKFTKSLVLSSNHIT